MNQTLPSNKVLVLFDEFGSPTFDKGNNTFVGVAVLYEHSEECEIFNSLKELMGLSNSKPLKNDRISKGRAIRIAKEIAHQNIKVNVKYLNLTNTTLREYTKTYTVFGNFSRKLWRGIEGRKDAHFLHSQVLQSCLFDIISRYTAISTIQKHHIEIIVDDWSYPKTDTHIVLDYSAENLQKHIQELINNHDNSDTTVTIEPIQFFGPTNSPRATFIDVLTSVISRSFVDKSNVKFDTQPLVELSKELVDDFVVEDITISTIEFIHDVMYKDIQETKIQDDSPIIIPRRPK